jgi:predicted O-methyltransferase YrrM
MGSALAMLTPRAARLGFAQRVASRDPQVLTDALGPLLNRPPNLDNMPFDVQPDGGFRFEHLAGLFASSQMDHGVISMTVRQAAYLFWLIQHEQVRKIIEIGRYKGGSTFLMAAAMGPQGELWSIDIGEKETKLYKGGQSRSFDEMLKDRCQRHGLNVHILVGDSRTVNVDTGEVDLVFIDGDHTYEGVVNDFERFGSRVRRGGSVVFDDADNQGPFRFYEHTVGRCVKEIVAKGDFELVKAVDRMAHIRRV